MIIKRILLVLVIAGVAVSTRATDAQLRLMPVADQAGRVGLGLVLRRLNTVGIFMHTTAHPDDENNGLLAMFAHGQGYRTVLASATRGEGGQNEIGSELFDALSILRSEELLAAHRFDGAEQLFTRAVDFGYSFSLEETFEKWDRSEILRDFVYHIRSVRPDVMVALPPETTGGGLHHQASSRITMEAFHAAADPSRFPDQIAEGLRPWQPRKLYTMSWRGFRGGPPPPVGDGMVAVDTNVYDPLLGRTYNEIGSEARSMHKCQGMPQVLSLPGGFSPRYTLADTILPSGTSVSEQTMFDGVDTSIEGLVQYVEGPVPQSLTDGLAAIARHAASAMERFEADGAFAAVPALGSGLDAVRKLRASLATLGVSKLGAYEIEYRLAAKEAQFQQAILLAYGVRLEALADDDLVTGDQAVDLRALVANRGPDAVTLRRVAVEGLAVELAECVGQMVGPDGVANCESTATVPTDASLTGAYWSRHPEAARYVFEEDAPFGAPFRPTPFTATFELEIQGRSVTSVRPIEHRYEREIFSGEKRTELKVVPRFALRVSPEVAIIPTVGDAATGARELRVTVANHRDGRADGAVRLELPVGWTSTPTTAPVSFTREDEEQTVRFEVRPSGAAATGDYAVRAVVEASDGRFDRGYQVVEYPHTRRRHLFVAPESMIKIVEVDVARDLHVGYVMGVGDAVPEAIRQLGATVEFLDADQLAWGDLGRYDVIVTGVRAYERRSDLRAHNGRLLDYVENGGTVIVQYNKFEFNEAQYGPFPVRVGRGRVTDEAAPVEVLVPDHPVFQTPNSIDEAVWSDWVQERGLYFLDEKDDRYVDLVRIEDSFDNNRGPKLGALVEARHGRGRWLYVGLGLWRQLPAGTKGAYPLLANLLSLAKAPVGPAGQ